MNRLFICAVASVSVWSGADRGRIYTLNEQIAHKRSYLIDRLRNVSADTRVVLIGHSVGAYIALQISSDPVIAPRVHRVIGLCPTVHSIGASPNGQRMAGLFAYGRQALGAAASVLSLLPESLVRAVASFHLNVSGTDPAVSTVPSLIGYSVAVNATSMARDECKQMGPPHQLDSIFHCHDQYSLSSGGESKIVLFYAVVDDWAPRDNYLAMNERFGRGGSFWSDPNNTTNSGGASTTIELSDDASITHAFCLNRAETVSVADRSARWIVVGGSHPQSVAAFSFRSPLKKR